jgi:hypothetical protein
MKNSTIYSMALATVLVLSLVDAEARGLGAGGGAQQQQAPRVQQQQAPRVQQQQAPRVQQQQAPRVQQQRAPQSSGRPGGHVSTSAPSVSRLPQVRVQAPQRSQQVSRPAQVQQQALQQQRIKKQEASQQQRVKQQQVLQQQQQASQQQRVKKQQAHVQQTGKRPSGTTRPTEGQVQHFLNQPKAAKGGKPGLGTLGAATGGAAAAMALQRLGKPGGGDGHRAGVDPALTDRSGIGDNRPGRNAQAAQQIRNNYRQQNILNPRWWANHPHLANEYWHNKKWHNQDWHYWWRPATWAIASAWFPWGWSSPVSYDYGDNVLYDNDIVYMNGEQVATADDYYQQATQLASIAKDDPADKTEWLPLGVFALSRGDTGVSNTVLQLAVSKEGVISGTYYNSDTDTARPVKGSVDKKTQRAAWTFADGKDTNIVMEAGINNLTQDQTEALVHFGNDITQQWLMVRLQEPPAQKTEKGDSEAR